MSVISNVVFEPLLIRISEILPDADPYQAYCDFLAFRLHMAESRDADVENDEAFEAWQAADFPTSLADETVEIPVTP